MSEFPLMTEEEFNILKKYVEYYKPKRCLEWGIGWSTIHLSKYDFIQEYVGIEHNSYWYKKVLKRTSNKVKLFHAFSLAKCKHKIPKGFENKVKNSYVYHPNIEGVFDFIFIDGVYRDICLKHAASLLSETGVCFAHDTAREFMHSHFSYFKNYKILTNGSLDKNNKWHQGLTILWNNPQNILIENL